MSTPRHPPTRLTERFVEKLPLAVDGRAYAVRDTVTKGLMVVVHKASKVYVVQRDLYAADRDTTGRRRLLGTRRVRLGNVLDMTVVAAREKAQEVVARMRRGEDPSRPDPRPASLTLGSAWAIYLDDARRRGRAPRTIRDLQYFLDKYLADWRSRPLADIGRDRTGVYQLHRRLTERHGPVQANRVARALRAVYRRARRLHPELPEPPVVAVEFNSEERRSDRAMSAAELRQWWLAVRALPRPTRRRMQLFALLTGLRTGKDGGSGGGVGVVSLRWEHVDFEARCLRIPTTKTRRPLLVPLSRPMLSLLRAQLRDHPALVAALGLPPDTPWIWPADSRTGHVYSLQERTGRRKRLAKTGHDLRATYVTQARAAGIPKPVVEQLVGHANGDVHEGYINDAAMLDFLHGVQRRISAHLVRCLTRRQRT